MWPSLRQLSFLLPLLLLWACGDKVDISQLPPFRYYLESPFTGKTENALVVEGEALQSLFFKLGGQGFTAEAPLNVEMPVRPLTKLQFIEVGDYQLEVTFYKPDRTPLFKDTLPWSYSLESPNDPIVGFSEAATNDVFTVLLVAESRDPGTNEIWIEGDIAPEESPEGKWRPIPATSNVPLRLSAADGLKTVKIRLRNEFKNPTAEKVLQILKKSQPPTACEALVIGTGRASRFLPIRVSAQNDGPLYYRVYGDLDGASNFQKFEGHLRTEILLSRGFGPKKFTVQIKDEAENYCLREEFTINYDATYQAEGISLKDKIIWSDNSDVTVLPRVDHFPSDSVEMFIHGDIEAGVHTFQWIPFREEVTVKLSPINGHRWVRVQYKVNGVETSFRHAPVYLKPFILAQSLGDGSYRLVLSDILGLDKLSISGCTNNYTDIAYSANLNCVPTGSQVDVRYDLLDGTSILRSVAIPP